MAKQFRTQDSLLEEHFGKRTATPEGEEGAGGQGAEGGPETEEQEEEEEEDELLELLGTEEEEEQGTGEPGEGGTGGGGEEDEFSSELSDEEFEAITSSKDSFQQFIGKLYTGLVKQAEKKTEEAIETARQEILKNIPEVVQKSAQRSQNVQTLITEFYQTNPQLAERKAYVRDMTKLVSTLNPDWTAKQVLDEVAIRAQRDIGAGAEANMREKHRSTPKFAGAGGRRAPAGQADTRSKQEKLLDQTFGF